MLIYLYIAYGCFHAILVELSRSTEIQWTAKPNIFIIWPFIENIRQSLV